jgi:lysozyme family protein
MMEDIITDVMKAEGWDKYTNRPNDRGGPTKWGITLKAWSAWRGRECTARDVMAITEPQARDFYEMEYVISPRFNLLPELLAPLLVDCGVNHGPSRAAKWLQRAVMATEDGVVGPKTINAVTAANPVATYIRVCAYRSSFYGKLVTDDPTQAEFAHGWANRNSKWLIVLADYLTGG